MNIALSSDSSCTITKELSNLLKINILPLNVIVDGQEFLDGVNIVPDELLISMRNNKKIKTSTPPPSDIISYFQGIFDQGFEHIIHFTISSKLSSMNELFNNIVNQYFPDKITIIDSYSVCAVMLSHVLTAHELIKQGESPTNIKNIIDERKNDNAIVFIPENLNALKNGGRISPAVATLCNLIGIKPVLHFNDGALEKECVTKNPKKTLHEKLLQLISIYPIDNYDYTIHTFSASTSLVEFVSNDIKELLNGYEPLILPIAINVCAHAGPGTIGLIVSRKIEGKSLREYFSL